jgi:hypothetical protein
VQSAGELEAVLAVGRNPAGTAVGEGHLRHAGDVGLDLLHVVLRLLHLLLGGADLLPHLLKLLLELLDLPLEPIDLGGALRVSRVGCKQESARRDRA